MRALGNSLGNTHYQWVVNNEEGFQRSIVGSPALQAIYVSGGQGTRSTRFPHLLGNGWFTTQDRTNQQLANLRSLPVVAGLCWVVGIGLCTLCAQFGVYRGVQWLPPAIVLAAALPTSRRKGFDSPGDDDSSPGGNASYSRFSSDLQTDRSISDQQRKCRDAAERLGLIISPALEFKDEAVSGAKHVREGFDGMLLAARNGQIQTLTIESLSRLARDSVLTMQTLRELVYVHKVRFLSIDDGIDTSRGDSWELVAAIMGIQNEQYLKALSKSVFRGQEGVVLDGLCVGDYCFGYSSEPSARHWVTA